MRLIDADALKADYGMKDYCSECEKELQGKIRECQYNMTYTKMDFCGWIDDAPTIEPEHRWIPVTERMPEYGTEVVTINKDDEYEINHVIDEEDGEWFLDGAVAWMPLPPVYKENENERS